MSTQSTPTRDGSTTTRYHWTVLVAALSIVGVAISLPQAFLFSVMPLLGESVSASPAATGWLLTGFLIMSAAAMPLAAQLGTIYGNRKVLLACLTIALLGQVVSATSTNIVPMIIGSCLAGIGFGAFPASYALIGEHLDENLRALAVGILGGALLIVIAGSSLIIGPIVDNMSYHWVFWTCAIAVALSLALALLTVDESPTLTKVRVDWAGCALLAGSVSALLIAVNKGSDWGWTAPVTLGLIVLGIAGIGLFIPLERAVERRGDSPAVSIRVLLQPGVYMAAAMAIFGLLVLYTFQLALAYFVSIPTEIGYGFGYTVTETNYLLFVNGAVGAAAAFLAGYLNRWIDPKVICVFAGALWAVSDLFIVAWHSDTSVIYLFAVINGLGMGLLITSIMNLVLQTVSEEDSGPASGVNLMAQSIGSALGVTITTAMLTAGIDPLTFVPTEATFEKIWYFCAAGAAMIVVCAVALPFIRTGKSSTPAARSTVNDFVPATEASVPAS